MHLAKLASVALIENDDHMLLIDRMPCVLLDKSRQLLDGRDDDPAVIAFELSFEDRRRGVAVCGTLFKAVVFLHRLIVEVFAVDDKKHFVDIGEFGCLTRRLERG